MKWKEVIQDWRKGIYLEYPPNIKVPFIWETSVLDKNKNNIYKEVFIKAPTLPNVQDSAAFEEYIQSSKNKYATSFKM